MLFVPRFEQRTAAAPAMQILAIFNLSPGYNGFSGLGPGHSKPNNRTRNYRPGQLFSVGVVGIVLFVSVVLRRGASIPCTRGLCRHHLRDAIFVCASMLYGPTVERVYGQTVVASTIPFIVLQTVNTSCQDYSQTINIRYPSSVDPSSSYLRRRLNSIELLTKVFLNFTTQR